MTREEAIKLLDCARDILPNKAIDMAIEALKREEAEEKGYCHRIKPKGYLSADAVPTVIRSKTLMPTKDFKVWAKRIREENPNAVIIPCDAEVVSADSVVRCKDCRYFKKIAERSDSGLCHRDIVASAWKENGYCSRGERND